jgi:hypothetical protein
MAALRHRHALDATILACTNAVNENTISSWRLALVAAILLLTVVPPDYRPVTQLPHNGDT